MEKFQKDNILVEFKDVMKCYDNWQSPTVIISDGAFGLHLFEGDPWTHPELVEWYEPHIKKWSEHAQTDTTLWFWNTEIGWATVHPILEKHGWEYRGINIWNKTLKHIAGNSNTQRLRKFPVVTEVCAHYIKKNRIKADGREMELKEWIKFEWNRSGLPQRLSNEACGVKDAATRKYLTQCHLWYFPPPDMFQKLVDYANEHGTPKGRPYYSIDGKRPMTGNEWERMRAKFKCPIGVTNVWEHLAVRGDERIKVGSKAIHANQKPLKYIKRIIEVSSDPSDVVWDPFGGVCTTAVACMELDRKCFAAEQDSRFFKACVDRIKNQASQLSLPGMV